MGRPGLMLHRKTKRLAQCLDLLCPGQGKMLARGSLELVWEPSYETGNPYVGDAVDVESRAEWRGEPGKLCAALADAGGKGHAGFIDEGGSEWWQEGEPGTYRIHDLYDHAPDYVVKRLKRETERVAKGQTISELRAEAGRKGAAAKKAKAQANDRQFAGHLQHEPKQPDGNRLANDQQLAITPAPAPAPAPLQEKIPAANAAPPPVQPSLLPEPDSRRTAEVREVFEHWKRVRNKRSDVILSEDRAKKIRARLREGFTVARLCEAIDHVKFDDWEERPSNDDLDVLLRDAPQVDRFLAMQPGSSRPPPLRPGASGSHVHISDQSKTEAKTPGRKFI